MATASKASPSLIIEPAMVRIPAGCFTMGCDAGLDCERPAHRVWVDEFELAPTQVTNREFERFLRATGGTPPPYFVKEDFRNPAQPVVAVSWF